MEKKMWFSVDLHDSDGDVFEEGIYVHLPTGIIMKFDNLDAYDKFIESMQGMRAEIKGILDHN